MKKKDFPPKPPSAMHTTPAFLSPQTPPETLDELVEWIKTLPREKQIEALIVGWKAYYIVQIRSVVELLERAQKDTYMVSSTDAHHVLWGAIDEAIGILKEAIK